MASGVDIAYRKNIKNKMLILFFPAAPVCCAEGPTGLRSRRACRLLSCNRSAGRASQLSTVWSGPALLIYQRYTLEHRGYFDCTIKL